MRYFTYISHTYALKNQLEKAVFKVVSDRRREIIPAETLKQFQEDLEQEIERLNKTFSRCKPIKPSWWNPGLGERDIHLQLGGGICHFHLYAEKQNP